MDIIHLMSTNQNERSLIKIRSIYQKISVDGSVYHEITLTVDGRFVPTTSELGPGNVRIFINYAEWNNWNFETCRSKGTERWCCLILVDGIIPGFTKLGVSVSKNEDSEEAETMVIAHTNA
jgi:hypothetical protein